MGVFPGNVQKPWNTTTKVWKSPMRFLAYWTRIVSVKYWYKCHKPQLANISHTSLSSPVQKRVPVCLLESFIGSVLGAVIVMEALCILKEQHDHGKLHILIPGLEKIYDVRL